MRILFVARAEYARGMQPETGFNARLQSGRSAPPLSASKKRAASWIEHAAEFAAHTDCPFRAFGGASMPCEKNETAIKPLQVFCRGFLLPTRRILRYVRRRLGEAKTVPSLTSFQGFRAKSFQNQIRNPNPPHLFFPQFPIISRFQTHLSNIRQKPEIFRKQKSPAARKPRNR